jgi:TonB family protein
VYNRNHDEVTEYYDNGRIWKKGSRNKKGELKWQDCYGTDGRDTSCKTSEGTFQFVEQMPAPGFNMMEHLINNMHYPEVCRLRNIEGRVLVQFVVYEDGAIGDVIIKKSVHPALDAEAYRVISIMPKWKPGMQNGKKVKVFYTQPITFKLQ